MQTLSNAGFFVFYCNPRGSDGRGDEFADISGRYGTIDFSDIIGFTNHVLEKYPEIDEKKLGIVGGSYGGFMVNWIITHTNRFAAAVSQRSISNWISFEHTSDFGKLYIERYHGTSTFENTAKLWSCSPLKYANNCNTPTLFIHADEDYRCFMTESISMYCALKSHGTDARLLLFHGENHDLAKNGNAMNKCKRLEEMISWLNKYLK